MIDIQWKGKVGYGDIVSPICYAHNLSFKLKTKVNLTFRWSHGPLEKSHPSDPETLWGRANYINTLCKKEGTDVTVSHSFDHPLNINHSNYDWDVVGRDIYHNYWMPEKIGVFDTDTIIVNTTERNVVSLQKYGKAWKDPMAGQWHKVIDKLSKKYKVRVVDYRTPVEKLHLLLQRARGFVGYHGTAAWPARFMHTPSILFATGGSLTRNAFPYAQIESTLDNMDTILDNPEPWFVRGEQMIKRSIEQYATYMPSEKFQKSLTYEL